MTPLASVRCSFRLIPIVSLIYEPNRKMAPIVFDDPPPTFDDVLKRIAALEKAITALKA